MVTSIQSGRDLTSRPMITSDCGFRKKKERREGKGAGRERNEGKREGRERLRHAPSDETAFQRRGKEGGTQGQRDGAREKLHLFT